MKSINRFSLQVLLCDVKTCGVYCRIKLSRKFQLKDQIKKNMRLTKSEEYNTGKDSKSHLFKHSVEINHKIVTLHDFKIVGKGCKRPKFKRKLAEPLQVKGNHLTKETVVL